jgi:hypothetical protein
MVIRMTVNGKMIFARRVHLRVSLDYLSLRNAVGFGQIVQIEKLRRDVVTTDAAKECYDY